MRSLGSRHALAPSEPLCALESCGPVGIFRCLSSPAWGTLPLWNCSLVLIGLSIIMSWGVNLTRFSVLPAIVMHAAFNTVSRFLNGLFVGVEPRASLPF